VRLLPQASRARGHRLAGYYPPDFDPERHVTLNNYHDKHALGVRASKLKHGGGLIVRFELPFNIWCGGCDAHIGQGVRFNAEKIKVYVPHPRTTWLG
jgi:coiled-coil domain-containing protein 130